MGDLPVRYLICTDAAQVEHATKIWGNVYTCISREQAFNGMAAEIADKKIVIWPTPEFVEREIQWGREFARVGPEVRLIHTELGNDLTPAIQVQLGWTGADSYRWMSGGQDDYNRIEILEPANEDAIDAVINTPARKNTRRLQVSDSPEGLLPAEADPAMDGSPAAPSPPLGAQDGPDESGFNEELPLEAYSGDLGPLSPDEAYTPYVSHETAQGGGEWPEPVDFWREIQVPEMRREWAPPQLADFLFFEAESWGTDPGIYVMYCNGICGGVLSNAIGVQVKDGDEYAVKAARLWIGVSAFSGSGKSPVLASLVRPLEQLQETLMQKVAYLQKKYIDDFDVYQKQRHAYIAKRAENKATPHDAPQEPEKPARNRLIVKNATQEALPDILNDNGNRGILGIYDELTAFPAGAGQYKKGGNDIDEMLKLRDGGPHSVDRKGLFVPVKEYGMPIVGGTQPNRIRSLVKRMDLTSNGFLQRFNFYIAREATLDLDRPAHIDYARLKDILERIYELMPAQHSDGPGPVVFSEGAQKIRRQLNQWCFEQRKPPWLPDALKSHLSKFKDMFAEFCLTYHAIESADEHCAHIKPEISEAIAQRVLTLMQDCLWSHAKAFYTDVLESGGETMEHVRYLAGKILAKGWTTLDLTTIAHGWTKWRKLKDWEKKAILTILQESGWTQSLDPRGYVSGMTYRAKVHPEVLTIFARYVSAEQARLEEMADRRAERMVGED